MYPERCNDYLNNRHYDPSVGVFVSVDPLVTKTMQPYIYGNANPVRFSDPNGLEPRPIHCRRGCGDPRKPISDPHGQNSDGYGDGPREVQNRPMKPAGGGVASASQSDAVITSIAAEMMINRRHPDVQLAKPAGCGLMCMMSGPQGLPGQVAQSAADPATVIRLGLQKFRAGAEWDHKPLIRSFTGDAEWIMIDSERAVRFDVFSNVHYGFIFAEMQVSEPIAQAAANGGEIWGPLREITGSNDAADRLAVSAGYQLHDAVPAGDPSLLVYSSSTRDVLLVNFDQFVQLCGACRIGSC